MRKEATITLEDDGNSLTFHIKQMPATQLESWIFRAVQVLGSALELPEGAGLEAVGSVLEKDGLRALAAIDYDKAKPLLDEMLGTASRMLDGVSYPCTIDTVDGYIGNVSTLLKLRMECFRVNLGFFGNAAPSGSAEVKPTSPRASKAIRMSTR